MKTAVVFYSLGGSCAYIAKKIKSRLDAELIPLHVKNEKKRGKAAAFFWAIGVMLSKKPKLLPYTFDPSAYDLIVIGAPVWAGSPASPVKAFLSQAGIKGKKTAIFVCHAGGKGNSLDELKTLLADNEIIAEADFINPINDSEESKRQIEDWINKLI